MTQPDPPITMIRETYDLPSHWASYLINGDSSSITLNEDGGDSEISLIDQFLNESELDGSVVDCSEESFFSQWHDVKLYGVKACDCLTFNFYK